MADKNEPFRMPPIEPQVRPLEPSPRLPRLKDGIGALSLEIAKLRAEMVNLKQRIKRLEEQGDDHAGQSL